jgi:hypothetical protein
MLFDCFIRSIYPIVKHEGRIRMKKTTPAARFISLAFATASLFIGTQVFNLNSVAQALPMVDQLKDSDAKTFLSILTIISLSLILITFLIVSTFLACKALENNAKTAEFLNSFLTSSNALQILTVTAVLVAAMFLGLADRLNDGVLALLSSVAGYVLGSLQSPNKYLNSHASQKTLEEQGKNTENQ